MQLARQLRMQQESAAFVPAGESVRAAIPVRADTLPALLASWASSLLVAGVGFSLAWWLLEHLSLSGIGRWPFGLACAALLSVAVRQVGACVPRMLVVVTERRALVLACDSLSGWRPTRLVAQSQHCKVWPRVGRTPLIEVDGLLYTGMSGSVAASAWLAQQHPGR